MLRSRYIINMYLSTEITLTKVLIYPSEFCKIHSYFCKLLQKANRIASILFQKSMWQNFDFQKYHRIRIPLLVFFISCRDCGTLVKSRFSGWVVLAVIYVSNVSKRGTDTYCRGQRWARAACCQRNADRSPLGLILLKLRRPHC